MTNPPPILPLPDRTEKHPIILPDGTRHPGTVLLSSVNTYPNVEVGDWTYASAFDPPENWIARLAPYIFPHAQDRLQIGKFCQIADSVRFITATANHWMTGPSTYPFPILDMSRFMPALPDTRDIVVGHDVWLAYGAMVLAGSRIGNGVIVGAGAVVRGNVPDYAVVIGNPAQVVRMRYSADEIDRLNALAWWDWPKEAIEAAEPALLSGSVADLEAYAP